MFTFTNLTTVDGIMSQLTNAINNLETLANVRTEKAGTASYKAATLIAEAREHKQEAERAVNVAAKIKALVS